MECYVSALIYLKVFSNFPLIHWLFRSELMFTYVWIPHNSPLLISDFNALWSDNTLGTVSIIFKFIEACFIGGACRLSWKTFYVPRVFIGWRPLCQSFKNVFHSSEYCNFTAVFIYASLLNKYVNYCFMCLWAIYGLSFMMCLFKFCRFK